MPFPGDTAAVRRLRLAAALVAAMVAMVPALALAQPTDADRATARGLAGEGQEALDAGDFARAADRFARADAIIHAPTLSLGLARAQAGLGKLVSAQETYNRILREGAPVGAPPVFALAVASARKEVDALAPRVAYVTVAVQGADAAVARVAIDGVPIPGAAIGVRRPVDPGLHTLTATATGFAPREETIVLADGKAQSVLLQLAALASPSSPPVAPLPALAPLPVVAPLPADAGLAGDGPRARRSPRKTLGFVGVGVGVAGLGLGIGAGVAAVGMHGTLKTDCGTARCPAADQPTLDSYHTVAALSTLGFVVAGVGLAGGAVLLVTAPREVPAKGAFVSPYVGPASVGAVGRF